MRSLTALLLLLAPVQLTEPDRVRAELHQARVSLLQTQEALAACQITLQKASLTDEQGKLEARFREMLKPAADAVWSWERLAFEPAK